MRRSRVSDDRDELEQTLEDGMARTRAWEDNLQREAMQYVQNETLNFYNAAEELRAAGTEAVQHESQRARATEMRSQEQVQMLTREAYNAQQSELRGEGRVRQIETYAAARLGNQELRLQQMLADQGHQHQIAVAEMRSELLRVRGQQERAGLEYEMMRQRSEQAEAMVNTLRTEMTEQLTMHSAQFAQMTDMFQDLMQRFHERDGDGPGATQAIREAVVPEGVPGVAQARVPEAVQENGLVATRAEPILEYAKVAALEQPAIARRELFPNFFRDGPAAREQEPPRGDGGERPRQAPAD